MKRCKAAKSSLAHARFPLFFVEHAQVFNVKKQEHGLSTRYIHPSTDYLYT
jgi:hypothetical protein